VTSRYRVSRSRTIESPASRVYRVIADYRRHHPHIVPPEYFPTLEVTAGGLGAGTRTRVEMRVLGSTRTFEQVVTEPEPGRVILETDADGRSATTFTVDDGAKSGSTHVTITTELNARPGLAGYIERLVTTAMLGRVYDKELARLADYAARPDVADALRTGP
jgi:uncharacterized protein YndB with AHSA1/START domain